jgi:type II secretory pathway component PulM
MYETLRVLAGMVLLILVAGIWACLWVPPSN